MTTLTLSREFWLNASRGLVIQVCRLHKENADTCELAAVPLDEYVSLSRQQQQKK
jgi:hypothetical protein